MSEPVDAINITTVSGFDHIDALLNTGPDWNYLTENGTSFHDTIYYSFSITTGTESGISNLTTFNTTQQQATHDILKHAAEITNIDFQETSNGDIADIHFASSPLEFGIAGLCSTQSSYSYVSLDNLTNYAADAWVYLDNATNSNIVGTNNYPVAGEMGYETLLHEIGHALGLKHPFEESLDNPAVLSFPYTNNTAYTVMSYTDDPDGPFAEFNEYDQAALKFLYGDDGLGGDWGLNAAGTYLLGSTLDEVFTLSEGMVLLDDLGGIDTLKYSLNSSSYTIMPAEQWLFISGLGADHKISSNVEYLQFTDGTFATSDLLNGDIDDTPWGADDHFVLPQYASPGVIGSGAGNDTYLLSPSLLTSGRQLTLTDTQGSNSIQLADGLAIASSQVTGNALQLTLTNGTQVTVLGADDFGYEPGGNRSAGIDANDLSFSQFVSTTLGTTVPVSGVNSGGGITIGGGAQNALPVASVQDHFVIPQYASPGVIGSGAGDDTYLLTASLIGAVQQLTLTDTEGSNSIQLADGLAIASSQVAGNALQLTLTNGAQVTVLGADNFGYEPGGNRSAGIDATDVSFSEFVGTTLGTSVPNSGVNTGGAVTIGSELAADGIQLAVGIDLLGISDPSLVQVEVV